MEIEKAILKFRISTLENIHVSSFMQNKTLWSFSTNFCPLKRYFGDRIEKTIVQFRINTLEYLHIPSFLSNKALWKVSGPNLSKISVLRTKFRKITSHDTLFWVNIKQFTKYGVKVAHSRLQRPLVKTFWIIVGHSGS